GFGVGNPGPFDEKNLFWQIRHGLIYPCYLLRMKKDGPITDLLPAANFTFDANGSLQKIGINKPQGKHCHTLAWYKRRKQLVVHPSPKQVLETWPYEKTRKRKGRAEFWVEGVEAKALALFCFRQVCHAWAVHRLTFTKIDWLSTTAAKYTRVRADRL